jgi:hypothetical protein
MDGTLSRRILLAAVLGLGACAALARADGPVKPVPATPQAPATLVINGMVYTNTGIPAAAPASTATTVRAVATVPSAPTPAGPSIQDTPTISVAPAAPAAPCATCAAAADGTATKQHWYNFSFWHNNKDNDGEHKQIGCWAHFNNYSCGSWQSEAAFMFGSCRNFFGEPCMGLPEPAFPGEKPPRNICPNCARP